VKSIRLDDLIQSENIAEIHFMKFDCEGAEYSILYSLNVSFFEKVRAICIETHKGRKEEENIHSLNEFITRMGYKTIVLDSGDTGYIWAWRSS
ncbi:FkbM family methyltransferase, partial [Bacteroidota bacterium]